MDISEKEYLSGKATDIRALSLRMFKEIGKGHVGGAMSISDLLAVLYFKRLNIRPEEPRWADRDRLVLSKGHAGPALYAALALRGYFPVEECLTLNQPGTNLPSHCDMNRTVGVDMTAGSLAQGFSASVGMALACRLDGRPNKVYAIIGDGESQEGLVWEASMAAAHYKLDNLTVILDHNGLQIDGTNDEVMSLGDIKAKALAFGYDVIEVADGNDMKQVVDALHAPACPGKPRYIILNTLKGKGVSFMEGQVGWHGKAPNAEQAAQALKELEG